MKQEFFYHIGLSKDTAKRECKEIQYVCVAGTDERAERIANKLSESLLDTPLLLGKNRFVVYKVKNVIVASHGMGGPSLSICINELLQCFKISENKENVVFFRIGTCGGIGVKPGSVVVTSEALNEYLEPYYNNIVLFQERKHRTYMDPKVVEEIVSITPSVIVGKTMTANEFYENQGRVDGAYCSFTQKDQTQFLTQLYQQGVRNIEMEAVQLSAIVHRAGYSCAVVCLVLINRLEKEHIEAIVNENAAIDVVVEYITRKTHSIYII